MALRNADLTLSAEDSFFVNKNGSRGEDNSVFRVGVGKGIGLTGGEVYGQMTRSKKKRLKKKMKFRELRKMNVDIGDNNPANMEDSCSEKGFCLVPRQISTEIGLKQAKRVTSSLKEAPLESGLHTVSLGTNGDRLVLEGQNTLAKNPLSEKDSNPKPIPAGNSSSLPIVREGQLDEQLISSQRRRKKQKENEKKREELDRICVSTMDYNPTNRESDCFEKASHLDSQNNTALQSGFQEEENSSMKDTSLDNGSQLSRSERKKKKLKEKKKKHEELSICASTVDNNPMNMKDEHSEKGSHFDFQNNSGLRSAFEGEEISLMKDTALENDKQLRGRRKMLKEEKKKCEELKRPSLSTVDINPTDAENVCCEKGSHVDSLKNSGSRFGSQGKENSSMRITTLETDSQLTSSQSKRKRLKENGEKREELKRICDSTVDNNPTNMKNDCFEKGSNFHSLEYSHLQSGFKKEESSLLNNGTIHSDSQLTRSQIKRKRLKENRKKANLDIQNKMMLVASALHSSLGRLCIGHQKKLLVLDLNGILVDVAPRVERSYMRKIDLRVRGKKVFRRPFCDEFIKFCFERFNVGIWSSRMKVNAEKITSFLFGDSVKRLFFCWDRSHCTITKLKTLEKERKPLVLKELKKLWEKDACQDLPWEKGQYDESNTLLVDDSPYKALRNPAYTAVFPYPYEYNNDGDRSLGNGGELHVYLEGLANASNVQKYVQENPFGQPAITELDPSWDYYKKVLAGGS